MSPKTKKLKDLIFNYTDSDKQELKYTLYELVVDSFDTIPVFSGVKMKDINPVILRDYANYDALVVYNDDKEVRLLVFKPKINCE